MDKIRFLFLLLFPIFLLSQLNKEKIKLLEPLSKIDYAESSHVGVGGEESEIYNDFEKIKNKFTNEELLFLAKNSSNSLRLYSCLELVRINEPKIVTLYEYYKIYPLKMLYRQGCEGSSVFLSDMILQEYKNNIYMKKELEGLILELEKEYKNSELIIYYKKQLAEIEKIINPTFLNLFTKIKEIDEKFIK
jgi:hypothetical protein